jgi:hypothetical protein
MQLPDHAGGSVGASGWDYRAPYAGSVEATLIAVQEQVLMSGDYIWPWDDIDPGYLDEDEVVPRPSSLAGLAAAKEIREFWDEGTHTILDIDRVIAAGSGQVGAIVPLSAAELTRVFSTQQPSAADFDRVYQPGPGGPLGELCGERWTGRSMVIYKDGAPEEVYFWGFSGD